MYLFTRIKKNNWAIKINTLQLVDNFSFPTLQLSAERKLNSYLSLNIEAGYQIYDNSTSADTIFLKQKGFKTNIEGRIYLQKLLASRVKSNRSELYVGLQLFYRENQTTNTLTYVSSDPTNNNTYEDDFGVKKRAKGINLTFGNQISITKKVLLEPFIVLGYMNKKVINTNMQYDENKHSTDLNDGVPILVGKDLESSSGNMINFGFGFRVGYRF
ncbi:DUF3575 domain-containing protein [Flavobacterium sp. 5]|uniref:DUF3575 domain-containing protein n=1 Tax=Flavobacterium sp. 5 TaxID=2035199 RepID=UPI000C2B91EE|nr:DUF3575 domain-containing protein [Flavobacterium sp. 5]PKB15262.1 uncharacterized protein DUF3575 [Flavobacterium sp. 5]